MVSFAMQKRLIVYSSTCLFLHLVSDLKCQCQDWCQGIYCLCFLLKVYGFSSYIQIFNPFWVNFCVWCKICCCSVVSNSLWPHELQHATVSCPSLSPRDCSNSCPLSQWCYPTIASWAAFFSFLPSVFPFIRVFSNELAFCIRWPKDWSFSISPCNEYSGLISFRIDSFDLLPVQGTLKSLLQQHSWKASILCHSAFFIVQLSHLYMTTRKTWYKIVV